MKQFAAQYIITNCGEPLNKGIVTTEDDGTVISVGETGGNLRERHSLSFFNGIIVPGFVNCHCHLELSYMKGLIPEGTGLGGFLSGLNGIRGKYVSDPVKEIETCDKLMADEGIVICADVCNSTHSFRVKKKSRIRYYNLLEVFGIDSNAAGKRFSEIEKVAEAASADGLEWYLVPHSVYSVSLPLFRMIKDKTKTNTITSIHFMESEEEIEFLSSRTGSLMDAYRLILSPSAILMPPAGHINAVLEELTRSGNLILVHNTYIGKDEIGKLRQRENLFYCLCPGSNRFITGNLPPLKLLTEERCDIVIGTDSLSSNNQLSILNELRILQDEFPGTKLTDMITWACLNGSKALGASDLYGSIEPGKKPGLVLIKDLDLKDMKLLPSSRSVRLI